MSRLGALKMIKRRARKMGLPAEIYAHSFRGTGITEYLRNGGDLEVAARIAGHESTRTTQLYNRLIAAAWPDLLRLAGSLKLGRVKADAVMRILQVKERPTPLARALAELGRIVKTIHVLDYVNDAEKRRRILVELNRQEYRHHLARRVCHGRRGELIAGYREGQEEKLGALGLMLNVIAFWNATYMQAVVENLQASWTLGESGRTRPRVSPLAHRHINFLGRYAFTLPEAVARGELRPLRDPNSE